MTSQPDQTGNQAVYDARMQRILDCVALRQPSRMPIVLYATFWLAKYGNVSHRQLMYDCDSTRAIAERAILEFEPDAYSPLVLGTAFGSVLDAAGYKQLQWPGHGVGDHQPFQYLDREYMKPEDFDEFLLDPTGFYLHTYLPRVASVFEGLEALQPIPGTFYFRLIMTLRSFDNPRVKTAFENIFRAAEEASRFVQHHIDFTQRMTTLGFPLLNGGSSGAPYDVVADYFRGARGMMTDLYRNKDKLLEMLDKMCTFLSRMTIANARAAKHPIVMIPVHWAPDAFMSDKQFREFWWPSFRRLLMNLIEADLIPMPLWESDCTRRLEVIGDIPRGKCIYWFERTDMVKAYEVLGDVVALRGNLSASLMTTGTPEQVDAEVRRLVEQVWNKGGNLILDSAIGLPDETPVDNVRAMFAAGRRYAG